MILLSRRRFVELAFTGVGASVVQACAPIAPPQQATQSTITVPPTTATQPATPTTPLPTAVAQPRPGGSLRLAQVGDLSTLDGHFYSAQQYYTIFSAYDRLTAYDANQQPQPMLAESWDLSTDATRIKLNLRKGVQFHSGREFTSDDVRWNLVRAKDPKTSVQQFQNQSAWFAAVDTPDKYTIVLTSDQPHPSMFDFFELFNMVDQDVMAAPEPAARVIGTGPFMLAEYAQGDHITFKKNPNYWRSGVPYLDSFSVLFLSDAQAMAAQLESGSVDVVVSPALNDAVRLQKDPNYNVLINRQTGQVSTIAANTTLAPTDNKLVRQALSYALNRQRIADSVLQGTSEPRSLPWRTTSLAFDQARQNYYSFDPDKARSLIEQSGLSNVELDFVYQANSATNLSLTQLYQADLAAIGVKMNLVPVDGPSFLDDVNKLSYHGVIGPAAFNSSLEPSTGLLSSKNFNPQSNSAGFHDDSYTRLITASSIEPDAEKRRQLYSQINDILLDQAFLLCVTTNPTIVAARTKVNGIQFDAHEGIDPADFWLS